MTAQGYTTRIASPSDLPGVLLVQRNAFTRVARAYDLPADVLPPLTESLEDLERLAAEGTLFLIAIADDGRIAGTVRGTPRAGPWRWDGWRSRTASRARASAPRS